MVDELYAQERAGHNCLNGVSIICFILLYSALHSRMQNFA